MTNVIPLPSGRHTRDAPALQVQNMLRLLDNITSAAEILEAMSEDVVGSGLPQLSKERVLQALFDAVTCLETASDHLAEEIQVAEP